MRALALFIALALAVCAGASARPRKIPVKDVQGRVLVWEPWSASWTQAVAGTALWESTLAQVTDGAGATDGADADCPFR